MLQQQLTETRVKMKKKIISLLYIAALACFLLAGCGGSADNSGSTGSAEKSVQSGSEASDGESVQDGSEVSDEESADGSAALSGEDEAAAVALEDGVYNADFNTDSSMFHVNEACEGKGTLTVKDGQMTIHISLVSKNIVNLFAGTAEDAQKDGAELIEPTTDTVTYSDGISEEVYGFDVPVPVLDEEFDVAIIGNKGTWYDHKVSVSNPEKAE